MITKIGLYGSGWRAEYFLRVAQALPQRFKIIGVVTRNDERAARYTAEFGVSCFKKAEDLIEASKPDFFVVSVTASKAPDIALGLMEYGFPVLLETPAAVDYETLLRFNSSIPKGGKIQIAEQYPFHPMHAARLKYISRGIIGTPRHVQMSFTHAYHAMALIRKFLGIGFENANITAKAFTVPVVAGYTRDGEPAEEKIVDKTQTVAVLDFDRVGKTALLNHEVDQHRSWVRSPIIQIKGERGEIFNNKIKYLKDYKTPIETDFVRKDMGRDENFEGYDLKGVFAADEWVYRNPYAGSRLIDDEIAVAACLDAMAEYIKGGASFYGLAEASQDAYLGLMVNEALKKENVVSTQLQDWYNVEV
ncbi:MAG: Gfo/Idh/MocA family oxidoreductase [Defluviitaleaceae bacterium]|nr:Gfo/Idh/MocA family oxidoreductase [Defluviitaleaceae bacterium]